MKTLIIIISIFTITTVVCGYNAKKLHKYIGGLKKCSEQEGGTLAAPTAEAILCAAEKYGEIINKKGEFVRDEMMQAWGDAIFNPYALKIARRIYSLCQDKADQSGITGRQQGLQTAACFLPVMPLVVC